MSSKISGASIAGPYSAATASRSGVGEESQQRFGDEASWRSRNAPRSAPDSCGVSGDFPFVNNVDLICIEKLLCVAKIHLAANKDIEQIWIDVPAYTELAEG